SVASADRQDCLSSTKPQLAIACQICANTTILVSARCSAAPHLVREARTACGRLRTLCGRLRTLCGRPAQCAEGSAPCAGGAHSVREAPRSVREAPHLVRELRTVCGGHFTAWK